MRSNFIELIQYRIEIKFASLLTYHLAITSLVGSQVEAVQNPFEPL